MAKKTESEYVILIEDGVNDGTFKYVGNVTLKAGSRASSAKREGLAKFQPEGGTVVAIPAEDWTPEDLKPKLSFG